MGKYALAIDQGTTSSRCMIFDHSGNVVSSAQQEFTQHYPQPGWVEHDPIDIWETVRGTMLLAMDRIGACGKDIASIGITNQRETTILWDKKTGRPVYNAIVWQCRRTADIIDRLKEEGLTGYIRSVTGLLPDAYFSGSKIKWILDNVPGVRARAEKGELLFGTVDSWIIWNLTGGKVHVTDYTNASRTMLFDIHRLDWDQDLLKILDIPSCLLPQVKPSSCIYGLTDPRITGDPIPICGAAGDQQSALFGQCCFKPGQAKNTYGTGCFMLMNTGRQAVESRNGLLTTIAASADSSVEYALEGSVFVAGAAIQWLRDELEIIKKASDSETIAMSVPDTAGVYVVPAFTGLGAPYWDQYARGCISGITRGFTRAHLVRATLESLAYQTYDILTAMEKDSGVKLESLKVDGGACQNNFLMQFQADIIGQKVIRPRCVETTAMGAACLGGLAAGFWNDREEIRSILSVERIFSPDMPESRKDELLDGWHKAVGRSLGWAKD